MRPLKFASLFILPLAATLSSCQVDEAEASFVSECNTTLGNGRPKLCSCIYEELHEQFSPEQMTRINTLFKGNITEGMGVLRKSGTDSDLDILNRISNVEEATEGCFKKLS